MSPILFNSYLEKAVRSWNSQLMTLNFPDQSGEKHFTKTDQVILADDENSMQWALFES
jgi:hypothetical protein